MDLFTYRSLVFALIEFILILYVLRNGKYQKYLTALIIFFLAGYQLGEFIFLSTSSLLGIQFATFSTTLLPPLGLLFIQNLLNKKYGGKVLLAFGSILALVFLLVPDVIAAVEKKHCLVKYAATTDSSAPFLILWGTYYLISLTYSIGILVYSLFQRKYRKKRRVILLVVLGYISFYPLSYMLSVLYDIELGLLASFMCALAILMAGIVSFISTRYQKLLVK